MTLKIIGDMKAIHFCNLKDPPFDLKHELMSADPLIVVKFDLNRKANFHYCFFLFHRFQNLCAKPFFFNGLNLEIQYFKLYDMLGLFFLGFLESLLPLLNSFDEIIEK